MIDGLQQLAVKPNFADYGSEWEEVVAETKMTSVDKFLTMGIFLEKNQSHNNFVF